MMNVNQKTGGVFLLLFSALSLFAQEKVKLWNDAAVSQKEKQSHFTVFLPEQPDASGISAIICPGGSYYWLDTHNEGTAVARCLNQRGLAAFVLHYRTAQYGHRHPDMIQDLERALQLVKENSRAYGIAPDKVGVLGFSAGGHLAGTAAIYSEAELKPYFAAMIYPVVSMEDSICHKKSRRNLLGKNYPKEWKEKMSLEKNTHADMPPVFLLHCTGDKTVHYANSAVFADALARQGVKHTFLLLEENGKGGHGFGVQPNGKATGWIYEFLTWLFAVDQAQGV